MRDAPISTRAVRWIVQRRRAIILAGAVMALAAAPPAILLYTNLRPGMEELLPASAPSVRALDELHARLGENMQLALYVSGPPVAELHRFADTFAERALALPVGAPRFVDYHPAETQGFFRSRAAFYLSVPDLEELERRLNAQLEYARRKHNPFDLGLEEPPPPVGEILDRYELTAASLHVYPSGYYDGADGHSLAMIIYPAEGVAGYHASLAFRDRIRALAKSVAAEMGLNNLKIELSGDVEAVVQEQRSLQSDLLSSFIIVFVLEALLLLAFFRWTPGIVVLGVPLCIGTVVTLAIASATLGSLNASTAFLGSIILGNGVNPGIILLARFVEERRRGAAASSAIETSVRGTLLATVIASSAAALAYGALMVTTFRGYSQFGFMGGLGMVLCWISTYVWLPPLAVALDRRWPVSAHIRGAVTLERVFSEIGSFAVRHARLTVVVAVVLALAAIVVVAPVAHDPYEQDTTKLRSRWASEPGGYLEVSTKVDNILQRFVTPAVVLLEHRDQAEPVAERYRELIRNGGPDLVLGSVMTLQSLVPRDQKAKLPIIARLTKKLTPQVLEHLDAKTRSRVEPLLPPKGLKPFTEADLPPAVLRQFREKDGSTGKLVLLFPKHGSNTSNGRVVRRFVSEIRSVSLPPGAVLGGSYLFFADMLSSISKDGPVATLAALLSVLVLSLALARGARGGLQVTISLIIGVLWTVGIAAVGGMRLNFLNFIALPITFGIGVDYATNVYGRYRLGPPGTERIVRAVAGSGAAVAACSATTVIGYSSLLLSRNGALFSFGLLAVMGEIACLAAALLVLPAMLGLESASAERQLAAVAPPPPRP